jgi:hypothetical protein
MLKTPFIALFMTLILNHCDLIVSMVEVFE